MGELQMRLVLILAFSLAAAGAAHAQFQPIQPVPPIPKIPKIEGPQPAKPFKPYTGIKPYQPPRLLTPANDPFSPEAEARRERKAAQPPMGGAFSPEGEAKRERAQAKHDAALNPF
jgi:hypothetical protein